MDMASNARIEKFLRQNVDYVDTDELGNPVGFEEKPNPDGSINFTFMNDGTQVTYVMRPGKQKIEPTLQYSNTQLKAGRRVAPKQSPGTTANTQATNGRTAERQKRTGPATPTQPSDQQPTQPSGQANTSVASDVADKQPTYLEQYLRLARRLIEG